MKSGRFVVVRASGVFLGRTTAFKVKRKAVAQLDITTLGLLFVGYLFCKLLVIFLVA